MNKTFKILNIILIAATLAIGTYYYFEGGVVLKGITSSGFTILGITNLIYALKAKACNIKFPVFMALGLLVCMIGDVVLNINFINGAIIFAFGHVLYFTAYCCLVKFKVTDLITCAVILTVAILFITLAPIFDFGSMLMEIVCIAYAFVISCMFGKGIANFKRERNAVNIIIVIGSALFFFSDLMLALNVFAGAPKIADTLCLLTYYPGQCVLGYSIYKLVMSKRTER